MSDLSCSICKNTPQPRETKHLYLKLGTQVKNI